MHVGRHTTVTSTETQVDLRPKCALKLMKKTLLKQRHSVPMKDGACSETGDTIMAPSARTQHHSRHQRSASAHKER